MGATRTLRSVVVLLAFAATACGGGGATPAGNAGDDGTQPAEASPVGTFALARSGCSYDGPAALAAGEATFTLASHGGSADFDLWLLADGHTYEELAAHIDEERRRSERGQPPLGHPTFATLVAEASTDPAGEDTLTTALQPGEYGAACIRFEEGRPGLWAAGPFTVEA